MIQRFQHKFAAGPESLDVRLFDYDDLPWDELAFPVVDFALRLSAGGPYRSAELIRRLGGAAYVQLGEGQERWVSLGQLRLDQEDREGERQTPEQAPQDAALKP